MRDMLQFSALLIVLGPLVVFALALATAFADNTCSRGAPWRFSKRGES